MQDIITFITAERQAARGAGLMPHKLLLADDSVTIQRVIELTFADEDVQVRAVGDGKKAIASIQCRSPDIVLADVGMPERDGYEVAAFIKGNPQLANIPVLLLTGAFEPIDETRARAVGCDGVLVKPFEPQMVINRVKDLLAGRRGGLWGTKPTAPAPTPTFRVWPAAEVKPQPAAPAAQRRRRRRSRSTSIVWTRRLRALKRQPRRIGAAGADRRICRPTRWPTGVDRVADSRVWFSGDDLAGWDPDLMADPTKPAATSDDQRRFRPRRRLRPKLHQRQISADSGNA